VAVVARVAAVARATEEMMVVARATEEMMVVAQNYDYEYRERGYCGMNQLARKAARRKFYSLL
jgi:hypothetical protein